MSDPLTEFYDSLATEADVLALLSEARAEDLHLELKRKQNPATPAMEQREAEHFSKALSGFANSDGGVLLWGVGSNKREQAATLHPISDPHAFQRSLKSSLLNAVQPFVDDVRIDVIESQQSPGQGYIRCLIPRSEKTPHRAMLAGREYYKRSTEGFVRLEHWDLEDMFGRRPVPRLLLSLEIVKDGSESSGGQTTYRGIAVPTITNIGRGSARAVFVTLRIEQAVYAFAAGGVKGPNWREHSGYARTATTDSQRMVFSSDNVVLHPEFTHQITGIAVVTPVDRQTIQIRPDLRIAYEASAEHARVLRGELVATGNEIARAILPDDLRDSVPLTLHR